MMSARKHASQWTCRAPARDAGKAKSSQFDRAIVPIPSTQRTLIARLRDPADEVAWQRFEDQYRELVVRFTMRQGLQAADAEDVAQAVFAALMSAMKSFVYDSKRGRFRNYLFRAIRNEIPRQIAKSRCPTDGTQVLHMSALPNGWDSTMAPDEAMHEFEDEWIKHHYRLALADIRKSHSRESVAIFESLMGGQSVEGAAAQFSTTTAAVHKIKQRIRDRMKELVQRQIAQENE